MSLLTLSWAEHWFESARPKADPWDAADEASRQKYLNWASSLILSAFVFPDDFNPGESEDIKRAVCEQALWLMRRPDGYPELLALGLSRAAAGPLSVSFSRELIAPYICEEAIIAIGPLGDFRAPGRNHASTRPLNH